VAGSVLYGPRRTGRELEGNTGAKTRREREQPGSSVKDIGNSLWGVFASVSGGLQAEEKEGTKGNNGNPRSVIYPSGKKGKNRGVPVTT